MSDDHDKSVALVERAQAGTLSPMVAAVMQAGPDPATIEKMMDLQERWERNEAKKHATRAMVELKRNMPSVIARDKTVEYGTTRYTHASLAAAVEAVTGALTDHGFTATWHPSTTEREVSVTCRLQHAEGHCREATMTAPPDTSGHKNAAQAKMSTVTLLSRYTLLSMLGIATADMKDPEGKRDDGNPDKVDPARNLRAAAKLQNHGKTRAEAEKYLCRAVDKWTKADLNELRDWIIAEPTAEPEPGEAKPTADESTGAVAPEDEPPMREPGEEG